MKTTILTLMSFSILGYVNAQQLSNPGFENWDTIGDYTQPTSWNTLNPLAAFGFEPSTTITSDAHSGNYAVMLTSIEGQFTNYSGVICTGPILNDQLQPNFDHMKIAYTSRPSQFKFYYKSLPAMDDMGAITMCLTKWNATLGQADTIAEATMLFTEVVTTYTLAELNFEYRNDQFPDSMFVIASSSLDGFNPTPESQLILDDFEVVYGPTAIASIHDPLQMEIYPNPVVKELVVQTLNIPSTLVLMDVNGRVVLSDAKSTLHRMDVSNVQDGVYIVRVTDTNGNVESRKLMIQH